MAVTISLYNHTPKLFANGEVDLTAIKLMLLNNSATFTAAHTDISSISGNEVSGSGWSSGGELLSGVAVTAVTTNDAKLDADDVSVTATGGNIGPAYKAVVYDATGSFPLAFIDFGGSQEAGNGTAFLVTWNASGIITWTNAS